MGFGSWFKKKKKDLESSASDVESKIKEEIQSQNDLERRDHTLNVEETEFGETKIGTDHPHELRANQDNRSESSHSSSSEPVGHSAASVEIMVNIDAEVLRKAQAKGIDLSKTLEEQLRRMVSDT